MFFRIYKPDLDPKASVIVVHGHGDHSGGVGIICERLAVQGYIAYSFDLRGHGKSSGIRGFIRKWEEYRGDLYEFRKLVSSENPELPIYMVCHSLGGVISFDYLLYHSEEIAGIIAIAPAISYQVTTSEKILVSLMGKIKPDFMITKAGSPSLLTRDQEMIEKLQLDPLRHDTVTPGLGRGLMQSVPRIMNQAHTIKIPLLLMYGLDDEITPPKKLREFFDVVGSEDKEKVEYDSTKHRPFDDLCREQFFEDLMGWMDRKCRSAVKDI